jgi:hypothetical protein
MFHQVPVAECPPCLNPFPKELRDSAEANLTRQAYPRPALLTLGAYGSGFFGAGLGILLLLAPFDIGSYSIDGATVTGPEFLREAGIIFGAIAIVCSAISYGLWTGRTWTRPLMLFYWIISGAYLIGDAVGRKSNDDLLAGIFFLVVTLAAAGLYLYGRKTVVEYYRALSKEQRAGQHASEPDQPALRQ